MRAPHASDLTGAGARTHGGRWNEKGTAVLYASRSRALAAVEYLVHVDIAVHPKQLRMVTLGIPSDAPIETLEVGSLPKHWTAHPAPARLAAIGTSWARSARSLVLAVPSAVIPGEENLILNPAHADMVRVRIVEVAPFAFDPRLLRGRS